MKSLSFRVCLSLVALAATSVGCAAQVQDEKEDEPAEETVASAEEAIEVVPYQCDDWTLVETRIQFCGYQTGPYDTSPISVTCKRTCVTDRHMGFTPSPPPGHFACVSGETTCGAWSCPSCD